MKIKPYELQSSPIQTCNLYFKIELRVILMFKLNMKELIDFKTRNTFLTAHRYIVKFWKCLEGISMKRKKPISNLKC